MGAFHSPAIEIYSPPFWMPISHIAALKQSEKIDVVACCDVSKDAVERAKSQFDIPHGYSSAEDMFSRHQLDVLTIATRTPHKADMIELAIKNGVRAIHVEKPLCNSMDELSRIEKAVKSSATFLTYGCVRRYMPAYLDLKDQITNAKIGDVVDIHVEMGKAPLMWTHPHSIDQLLFFASPSAPLRAQAWFENVTLDELDDETVLSDPIILSATVYFKNGVIGRIGCGSGLGTSISGTKGRIEIFADGWQIFEALPHDDGGYLRRREISLSQPDAPGGTACAINLLVSGINGEAAALKALAESQNAIFDSQRVIFALLQSHLQGGAFVDMDSSSSRLNVLAKTNGAPA